MEPLCAVCFRPIDDREFVEVRCGPMHAHCAERHAEDCEACRRELAKTSATRDATCWNTCVGRSPAECPYRRPA